VNKRLSSLTSAAVAAVFVSIAPLSAEYDCDICYRISMYEVTCHWNVTGGSIYNCTQSVPDDCDYLFHCAELSELAQLTPDGSLRPAAPDAAVVDGSLSYRAVEGGTHYVGCGGAVVRRDYAPAGRQALYERIKTLAL
jgi:hypothetical protein